jgi:hypothetical protein
MKTNQTSLAFAALLLPLLIACGSPQVDSGPASVRIVTPTEGQVVEGTEVLVQLEASGVRITPATVQDPGTGHHHLFVDRDITPLTDTIPAGVTGILHMGQGQTEFLLTELEPGEHRLIAVVANWAHVPLSPPAVDTVRFTVVAPVASAPPAP